MATLYLKIEATDGTYTSYRKMLKALQEFQFPDEIKHGRPLTMRDNRIKVNLLRVAFDTNERVKADTREELGRLIIPSKLNYE